MRNYMDFIKEYWIIFDCSSFKSKSKINLVNPCCDIWFSVAPKFDERIQVFHEKNICEDLEFKKVWLIGLRMALYLHE